MTISISEHPRAKPGAAQGRVVRVGCGSGFWGDTPEGARQLIEHGGVASLRYDPQGKAHAQQLLDMPVEIPQSWADMKRGVA